MFCSFYLQRTLSVLSKFLLVSSCEFLKLILSCCLCILISLQHPGESTLIEPLAAGAVSLPSQLVCEVILCPVQEDTRFPFVRVLKTIRLQAGRLQAAAHTAGQGRAWTLSYCCSPAVPTRAVWQCAHWKEHRLELGRPGFESRFWPACGPALVFDRSSDLSILVFPSAE